MSELSPAGPARWCDGSRRARRWAARTSSRSRSTTTSSACPPTPSRSRICAPGQPADKRCFFLKISPRSAQVAAYRRTPARRGRDRHVGFRIATRFPFGLFEKSPRGAPPSASSSSTPPSTRCSSRRRRRAAPRAAKAPAAAATARTSSACDRCATATTRATSTGARARPSAPTCCASGRGTRGPT